MDLIYGARQALSSVRQQFGTKNNLSKQESSYYRQLGLTAGIKFEDPFLCDELETWPAYFWFDGYERGLSTYFSSLLKECFYDEDYIGRNQYKAGFYIGYYGGWSEYCPDEYADPWMNGFQDGEYYLSRKRLKMNPRISFPLAYRRAGWHIGRYGGDDRCKPLLKWGSRSYDYWLMGFEEGLDDRYRTIERLRRGDGRPSVRGFWEIFDGPMDDVYCEVVPE